MPFTQNIIQILKKKKINFFTGVPDSVLKNFSNKLINSRNYKHIITTNEGSAVSLAAGYYLATKKIPLVYLQNSGLGNIINPVNSMIHKKIYGIPMVLFVGWRGSPGSNDEIQHKVQGNVTIKQLQLLNIKYAVFNKDNYKKQLTKLIDQAKRENNPVAFLFKVKDLKTTKSKTNVKKVNSKLINRANFIKNLITNYKNIKIVATTGFTSRELFQLRSKSKKIKNEDFYMVGAMGHSAMVALGLSFRTNKSVVCLDGDGSFLMHMGSSIICSKFGKKNFKYILLNNNCHESVGKQPTSIDRINLRLFSKSIGYRNYFLINNNLQINSTLNKFMKSRGPSFLEVKIDSNSLKNLVRIKDLSKIKKNFLKK